jgi:hypothetical protein
MVKGGTEHPTTQVRTITASKRSLPSSIPAALSSIIDFPGTEEIGASMTVLTNDHAKRNSIG